MTKARTNADNASADIQGVTAGTGLSGGGTSGTVTLTNDMATTIAAKGDLVVGTGNDTYAALTAGNAGDTLVADSSASTGLRYIENYAAGKNRIINGAMLIDQRNNGASVTVNAAGPFYSCDRWRLAGQATDGVYTAQQDNDAPSGFAKSIKITTTTADASIGATQVYALQQLVEGFNVADFGWGAAGAKTVTISFWVRSSLTGTFGGSVRSTDAGRSYPFSYSISSANTWEKKSVTIAGDTTGTWAKDNTTGFNLTFALGAGADRLGTAGAWASANFAGATGQTNVIGTLNATWYITGIQLEIGSVATAFTNAGGTLAGELAACQRYYWRHTADAAYNRFGTGAVLNGDPTKAIIWIQNPVEMRVAPTSIEYSTLGKWDYSSITAVSAVAFDSAGSFGSTVEFSSVASQTAYRPIQILANNSTSAYLGFSAEL